MRKKTSKKLIIVFSALAILISLFLVFYFFTQNTYFSIQGFGFSQYVIVRCNGDSICKSPDLRQIAPTNSVSFNMNGNILRFDSTVSSNAGTSIATAFCQETTSIYRNGNLIDTINSASNSAKISKCYLSDGTITYSCNNQPGIRIDAINWYSMYDGDCAGLSNYFVLYLSNAFDINVSQLNNNYQINQTIPLQFKINNYFDIINATLRLNYDVPTIVGHYKNYVDKNVTLNLGINTIDITIPHDYPTVNLVITPELLLNYDTSRLNGLTYTGWNDDGPTHQMVTKYPQIQLADIVFTNNSFILSITNTTTTIITQNQTVYANVTCLNGLSCPTGYTCNVDGSCTKTVYVNNGTNMTVYANVTCLNGLSCPTGYTCNVDGSCTKTVYVNNTFNNTIPSVQCWVTKSFTQVDSETNCVNVSANYCNYPLYNDSASCEFAYSQLPAVDTFWNKYGLYISIFAVFLSILSSIIYIYFTYHKKKR